MKLTTPLTKNKIKDLKVGDFIELSGTMYTARDAAHSRIADLLANNQPLPFPLQDAIIYYVGPTPTPPNQVFGSAGPTTSARMDIFTPTLYNLGIGATIGKGYRSKEVCQAIVDNGGIYFVAIGGAGALLGKSIIKAETIAFDDLGCEAIQCLEVIDFPVIVAIDRKGNCIYD